MARFISCQQTSGRPSHPTPLPGVCGPTSLHWRETSGSAGSLQPNKNPQGSAASRLVSIRCGKACAGLAAGPDARTDEAFPRAFSMLEHFLKNCSRRRKEAEPIYRPNHQSASLPRRLRLYLNRSSSWEVAVVLRDLRGPVRDRIGVFLTDAPR